MMDFITDKGIAGAIGALVGSAFSAMGFRWKIADIEKRIDHLGEHVVYRDTCDACRNGCVTQFGQINDHLAEIRKDIKQLTRNGFNWRNNA